jgi:hypothetical protein
MVKEKPEGMTEGPAFWRRLSALVGKAPITLRKSIKATPSCYMMDGGRITYLYTEGAFSEALEKARKK